jgi:hypothetical protein
LLDTWYRMYTICNYLSTALDSNITNLPHMSSLQPAGACGFTVGGLGSLRTKPETSSPLTTTCKKLPNAWEQRFPHGSHLVLRTQSLVRALSAKYADDCKKTSPGAENCTGPAQEKPCFASTSPVSKCHVPSFVLHSVSCCFYVLPLFA